MKATTETKRKIFTALATITRLSWALSKDVYYTYGVFNIASLEDSKLWHYWIKYEQLSRMTDDVYRATAFQSGRKYLWYIWYKDSEHTDRKIPYDPDIQLYPDGMNDDHFKTLWKWLRKTLTKQIQSPIRGVISETRIENWFGTWITGNFRAYSFETNIEINIEDDTNGNQEWSREFILFVPTADVSQMDETDKAKYYPHVCVISDSNTPFLVSEEISGFNVPMLVDLAKTAVELGLCEDLQKEADEAFAEEEEGLM